MAQTGFFGLTICMLIVLVLFFNRVKMTAAFAFFILLWCFYLGLVHYFDLVSAMTMPPRIPLMLILPATVFSFRVTKSEYFEQAFTKLSPSVPVSIQTFRIAVELLIWAAFQENVLHERTTFEGWNFDILVGASASIVALLYYKKLVSLQFVLIWNFVSMSILLLTVASFLTTFYIFGDYPSNAKAFFSLPYLFLPGFLLPLAIFLHFFSIRQILFLQKKG
jgi:hypothetical protein